MKVIKQGQIPGEIIHRATCNHCKTEVEFKRKEGRISYDQRDGDSIMVVCPLCRNDIYTDLNRSAYNGPG